MVDRPIGSIGGDASRFAPKRLTSQKRKERRLGTFKFAGTILEIFVKADGRLYAKVPSGEMPIRLCNDGKVIVGNAPPTDIFPSLKDALGRK